MWHYNAAPISIVKGCKFNYRHQHALNAYFACCVLRNKYEVTPKIHSAGFSWTLRQSFDMTKLYSTNLEPLLAYRKARRSRVVSVSRSVFRNLVDAVLDTRPDDCDRYKRPADKYVISLWILPQFFTLLIKKKFFLQDSVVHHSQRNRTRRAIYDAGLYIGVQEKSDLHHSWDASLSDGERGLSGDCDLQRQPN